MSALGDDQQVAPSTPEANRTHIPGLDAIRGIAVGAVLLAHFGGALEGPAAGVSLLPAIHTGARGVDLFFVLSGYLITGILYDARGRNRYFLNFYARRALRIFPLYYGVLLVAVLLWHSSGQSSWQRPAIDYAPWLWSYTSNILIAWKGEWCLGAFDHLWSLAVEEQFYLVWPFVIASLPRKAAMAGCLLLIAIGVGSRILWASFGGNDVTLYSLTVFRLDTLAAGGWIALACRGSLGIVPLVRPARVTFAACSLLLLVLTFADKRLLTLKDTLWTLELSSFLVLMVWASRGSVFQWLGTAQSLKLLGKYSYGIYVYSHLLIWVVAPWLTAPGMAEFCGSPLLGQAAYLAVMAALTISTAVVSWHFFEMPFLSFKRYFPA